MHVDERFAVAAAFSIVGAAQRMIGADFVTSSLDGCKALHYAALLTSAFAASAMLPQNVDHASINVRRFLTEDVRRYAFFALSPITCARAFARFLRKLRLLTAPVRERGPEAVGRDIASLHPDEQALERHV